LRDRVRTLFLKHTINLQLDIKGFKRSRDAFTESDTPLYEEFLRILQPLSSHGIFRLNWLDICNPTSKKYDEQVCSEVMDVIIDHASIYGMAFHPRPSEKILKDFGNGMFIPELHIKQVQMEN
jgi:hypothetical protein